MTPAELRGNADVLIQLEIRAICLYAMKWRSQNEVDPPRTVWDDMLVEMMWLREDFKYEAKRKKNFMLKVAKSCVEGALKWHERICAKVGGECSSQTLGCGTTIPGWAREEYLAQLVLPEKHGPGPSSEGEKALELDPTVEYPEALPKQSERRAEPRASFRRSKRLLNLANAGNN